MRKVGNIASNQIYNAEGRKPPVPIDVDEADSAMERFIRQKYIHNVANESHGVRSPASDEGTPPPLPPKNSSKFGFRSASSIFPISSRAKKEQRAASDSRDSVSSSPALTNKPSRLFGSSVDYDSPDDLEKKLQRLREMGFQDSQRNAIVLKGVNGSLDRAIEALVRLGEGRSRSPAPAQPVREPVLRVTRSMTPLNSSSGSGGFGLSLNVSKKTGPDRPTTSSTESTNPFDVVTAAQPQTAQSTGTLHHKNPFNMSTNNPFVQASQQAEVFGQATGSPDTATPQPAFLHQAHGQAFIQSSPSPPPAHQQHAFQPSSPASSQHYQSLNFQGNATYPQPAAPAQQPMQTGYNSHLPQGPSPLHNQNGLGMPQVGPTTNPFLRGPTRIASPSLVQIPEQAHPNLVQPDFSSASPQSLSASGNPFLVNMQLQKQQQLSQSHMPYFSQQPFAAQPTFHQQPRHDKASILALYNQPAPSLYKNNSADSSLGGNTPSIPEDQPLYVQSAQPAVGFGQQPRSLTQPAIGGNNPFVNQTVGQSDLFNSKRHVSRESMNLGKDMAWTNGRHSPDAFASLSARHV